MSNPERDERKQELIRLLQDDDPFATFSLTTETAIQRQDWKEELDFIEEDEFRDYVHDLRNERQTEPEPFTNTPAELRSCLLVMFGLIAVVFVLPTLFLNYLMGR